MDVLVADKNQVLDRRIRINLADLRYRVLDAGDPYAPPSAEKDLKLRRVLASCGKLSEKLGSAALQVCMDPLTRPWAAYLP